jgi:hypothetical protein
VYGQESACLDVDFATLDGVHLDLAILIDFGGGAKVADDGKAALGSGEQDIEALWISRKAWAYGAVGAHHWDDNWCLPETV